MAGYLGTKAVLLSTTAASVGGDATVGGNLTVDTNTLYVDSTNNRVGIGTNLPSKSLELGLLDAFRMQTGSVTMDCTPTAGAVDSFVWNTSANAIYRWDMNGTQRMFIDSNGNVGIGVTSPLYSAANRTVLNVEGTSTSLISLSNSSDDMYFYFDGQNLSTTNNNSTGYMNWQTGGSERMRIDSSGNVGIGTTAPGTARVNSVSPDTTSSTFAYYGQQPNGTVLFGARGDGGFTTGNASVSPYNLTTGNAASVWVDSQGFLYRSTSSLKYKTDVQDATHGLAEVLALRSVTYKSNRVDASGVVPDVVYGGLIAEEVHDAGLTEFVQYADDGTPDALSYGNMVALCVKAIQEQQVIIDDLQTRIAALEAN